MPRRPVAATAALSLLCLACTLHAEIKTEDIEYKEGDTVLQGYLAYDSSKTDKRPGVLVVHEWWGLNDYPKQRAKQLAELGYIAFAADIYGKGSVSEDPKKAGEQAGKFKKDRELLRKRALAGLEVLRQHPMVDAEKIAAIGYCFGGTTVLEMARSNAPLAGVVSFHGGLDKSPDAPTADVIKPAVLVLHGGADPGVPDKDVVAFIEEMRKAKANWELIAYGGAKHGFTNSANANRESDVVGYQKRADDQSWQDMQQFFNELFKSP